MFGQHIFNPKIKQRNIFWVISPFYFFSFLKNASITHFKFLETRPRDNKILFKKIIDYRMKWIVLPYSESCFEETIIKITIK